MNTTANETRVAILEDGDLVELMVERPDTNRLVGDIYLGRVEAVLAVRRVDPAAVGRREHRTAVGIGVPPVAAGADGHAGRGHHPGGEAGREDDPVGVGRTTVERAVGAGPLRRRGPVGVAPEGGAEAERERSGRGRAQELTAIHVGGFVAANQRTSAMTTQGGRQDVDTQV